jgi:hypothetical protein
MKLFVAALLVTFAAAAAAQNTREAQCRRMAGEPGNPTYETVLKRCMADAAKPAAAASKPGAAGKPVYSEAQCRSMAGEPGNPTYEATLKNCLAQRR